MPVFIFQFRCKNTTNKGNKQENPQKLHVFMNFSRYRALKFSSAAQFFFECGGEHFGVRRRGNHEFSKTNYE
jgi:hypothetical protein